MLPHDAFAYASLCVCGGVVVENVAFCGEVGGKDDSLLCFGEACAVVNAKVSRAVGAKGSRPRTIT